MKPVLVIMAAGLGSRYGGLKQIDPIDPYGNIIIDFSIYDAIEAGFEKVVFIIKKENEKDFRETIGKRVSRYIQVEYVFQSVDALPEGFAAPEGRVKPWGTGHAILCSYEVIDGPFVVINADDYYGKDAFRVIYQYLSTHQDEEKYRYAMVGYIIENTLTDNGHVARGVCQVDEDGFLADIVERTHIEKRNGRAEYTEDGEHFIPIPPNSIVSMNMWGFSRSILEELKQRFVVFLDRTRKENPLKGEFFIPSVVDELICEGKATVQVLKSTDRWYGVTYKEDKEKVMEAIQALKDAGLYPQKLWR